MPANNPRVKGLVEGGTEHSSWILVAAGIVLALVCQAALALQHIGGLS